MRRLDSDSSSEWRLVASTAGGLVLLAVAIADRKWGLAALGGVLAAGAGFWSIHALDHGSMRRRIGWLGAQIAALVVGGGIALAAGLDGWWIVVPLVPAMFVGSWFGTRVLNGPSNDPSASVASAERPDTEITNRWSLGRLQVQVERSKTPAEDPVSSVFQHPPGSSADVPVPTTTTTSKDDSDRPRPFWHFLLFGPVAAVALTLRTHDSGHAMWWWVLLAVAVPCAVVYWFAMKRWKAEASDG